MENKKELVNEFKGLLEDFKKFVFGEEPKPNDKQAFTMNGTLEDGTPVMIDGDMPQVGVPVMVQNADGEVAPIPDGEYIVKVGDQSFTIKCIGGQIAESTAPEAPATPPTENNPNQEQMANEKIAELEARIAALEGGAKAETAMEEANKVREITVQMSSEIEALKKENAELKDKAVKMFDSVEKFLSAPAEGVTHKTEIIPTLDSVSEFRKKYLNLEL